MRKPPGWQKHPGWQSLQRYSKLTRLCRELDASHREQVRLPFLEQGAALLAPLLKKSEDETRLSLLSINYLVIRFALNSAEESAAITRQAGASSVDERIAGHRVGATRALLGVGASGE